MPPSAIYVDVPRLGDKPNLIANRHLSTAVSSGHKGDRAKTRNGTDLIQRGLSGKLHRVGLGPIFSGVEIPDVISWREADVEADALARHVGIVPYRRPVQRNRMCGGRGKGVRWRETGTYWTNREGFWGVTSDITR